MLSEHMLWEKGTREERILEDLLGIRWYGWSKKALRDKDTEGARVKREDSCVPLVWRGYDK